MADELTDSQIAMLFAIGEFKFHELADDRKSDFDRLVSGGYAEPAESGAKSPYRLTLKAHEFIEKRGGTLNA